MCITHTQALIQLPKGRSQTLGKGITWSTTSSSAFFGVHIGETACCQSCECCVDCGCPSSSARTLSSSGIPSDVPVLSKHCCKSSPSPHSECEPTAEGSGLSVRFAGVAGCDLGLAAASSAPTWPHIKRDSAPRAGELAAEDDRLT